MPPISKMTLLARAIAILAMLPPLPANSQTVRWRAPPGTTGCFSTQAFQLPVVGAFTAKSPEFQRPATRLRLLALGFGLGIRLLGARLAKLPHAGAQQTVSGVSSRGSRRHWTKARWLVGLGSFIAYAA